MLTPNQRNNSIWNATSVQYMRKTKGYVPAKLEANSRKLHFQGKRISLNSSTSMSCRWTADKLGACTAHYPNTDGTEIWQALSSIKVTKSVSDSSRRTQISYSIHCAYTTPGKWLWQSAVSRGWAGEEGQGLLLRPRVAYLISAQTNKQSLWYNLAW